jgi:hydroxymethylpyrimidine pyrophosphatase-like HAD family hydrolase
MNRALARQTAPVAGHNGQAPGLVLATDLDGTFLGGGEADRRELYSALAARDDVLLMFVTGRDLDFVRELIAQPGMPRPRYVVGDVGTSVYDVARDFAPVAHLEAEIAERWGAATDRVIDMLRDEPGLELQPTPFRHRVSYYYEPELLSEACVGKIEAAGFDCLTSAGVFLDVLPRGVAKGPTLRRIIQALDLPQDKVLVAGDTMNDLSMFDAGFKGVAVGNSEPRLIAALADLPQVYRSPRHGAAGVLDAIRHFQLD